jgi:hypothetical protein
MKGMYNKNVQEEDNREEGSRLALKECQQLSFALAAALQARSKYRIRL